MIDVAGVSVTDTIDALNAQLGANFFSQQARPMSRFTRTGPLLSGIAGAGGMGPLPQQPE